MQSNPSHPVQEAKQVNPCFLQLQILLVQASGPLLQLHRIIFNKLIGANSFVVVTGLNVPLSRSFQPHSIGFKEDLLKFNTDLFADIHDSNDI